MLLTSVGWDGVPVYLFVGQIGPAYYTVNDHDMYVYVVFVYACHYNK